MYRHEVYDQLKMEMPFGVTLREDNRWVILSKKFPWEEIDREYQEHFKSSEGQVAIPSRLAFGTLYIQKATQMNRPDEISRRTPICSTSADLSATPWNRLSTHP